MINILNTIGGLIILFIIGAGIYCGIAYCLAFAIMLFNGKFLKFVEWNVNNKWCFPTYYICVLSIGIIVAVIGKPDNENLTNR